MDYKGVFEHIVNDLENYVRNNNLKAMVLGISGGIDSTVCAAVCHEVSKKTGIPLIGRSLTIKNKSDETSTASLVGKAFCNEFMEINLVDLFADMSDTIRFFEQDNYGDKWTNPIADGNIQARLRMIYLYHLAGINKGIVIDTLNDSERLLGFWSICGDVGDYAPILNLNKTNVYNLAKYLVKKYKYNPDMKVVALEKSIELIPTDGLGISSSDLEQIGANSYEEVDNVLQEIKNLTSTYNISETYAAITVCELARNGKKLTDIDYDIVEKICNRCKNSAFKRKPMQYPKITDNFTE